MPVGVHKGTVIPYDPHHQPVWSRILPSLCYTLGGPQTFCKGPESTYFRLVSPMASVRACSVSQSYLTLPPHGLSMEFSKQGDWSGLPLPSPGNLPDPGIKARTPALQVDSLPSEPPGKPMPSVTTTQICHCSERSQRQEINLAGCSPWGH